MSNSVTLNFQQDGTSLELPANIVKYFKIIDRIASEEEDAPNQMDIPSTVSNRDTALLIQFYEAYEQALAKWNPDDKEYYIAQMITHIATDEEIKDAKLKTLAAELKKLPSEANIESIKTAVMKKCKLSEDCTEIVVTDQASVDKIAELVDIVQENMEIEPSGDSHFLCFYPDFVNEFFIKFADLTVVGANYHDVAWSVEEEIEIRAANKGRFDTYVKMYGPNDWTTFTPAKQTRMSEEKFRKKYAKMQQEKTAEARIHFREKCPIYSPCQRVNQLVYAATYFDAAEFVYAASRWIHCNYIRQLLPWQIVENTVEVDERTDEEIYAQMESWVRSV
jgi:hypothetical protein